MTCEYAVWDPPIPEDGEIQAVKGGRRELACGASGVLYQVSGQTGDLFKFHSVGLSAPVSAVLCRSHTDKLSRQGLEVARVKSPEVGG